MPFIATANIDDGALSRRPLLDSLLVDKAHEETSGDSQPSFDRAQFDCSHLRWLPVVQVGVDGLEIRFRRLRVFVPCRYLAGMGSSEEIESTVGSSDFIYKHHA
jgi:hypothetical protein